ncbi:hypothetical protein [Xylophilus sp.]|uniref:hypothetical protein n=1 Tax=Xylophilus sp. TaxID=2653893 RepID=UPI0013BCBCDF|nr:hypothetical protein [Xylophilus sp.]KAF1043682.1 MAG: hypothetical protein GAK38_03866 [Xylophilus sp.]
MTDRNASLARRFARAAAPAAAMLLMFCAHGATAQPHPAGCSPSEDSAACRREAINSAAEIKRGRIGTVTESQLEHNRIARCAPLGGEDKAACEARVSGLGSSSGSVSGGGVLHEVETVVLPAKGGPVRVEPKTDSPVFLVPDNDGRQSAH